MTPFKSSESYPLVTFVLLAYNQEKYIREAVEGAFSQTYSPLEIILSDDCSKDRTFEIMSKMKEMYNGPHRIILNRNQTNLGIGRHYNRVMELSSGEIVELAAGDDISLPWRTSDSVSFLQNHPEMSCVSLGIQEFIDAAKLPQVSRQEIKIASKWNLNDFVMTPGFFVNAPGRAFRKYTHDQYGPLIDRCPVEDGPNLLRCLIHGAAATCENIGVLYRWNGENISAPENISKISFSSIYSDYLNTIEIAFKLGHIDLATHLTLRSHFVAKMNRFEQLELFNASRFGIRGSLRMLTSNNFTVLDVIKLLSKRLFRFIGLRQ